LSNLFIQVPTDSTGKKVDSEELVVGANTVQRQRVQVAGATDTAIAPVDAANGLDVDVTRVQGTVTDDPIDRALRDLGKVDVASLDQYVPIDQDTGAGTVNALPVTLRKSAAGGPEFGTATDPIRTDPTGTTTQPISGTVSVTEPVSVDDNAGSLTVDAPAATPVAVRLSDGAAFVDARQIEGRAAHDVAIAGNPVQIGVRANANEPTAVADGDATHLWADLLGRLVVLTGHPSPEAPVAVNATASGNTTVIAAPGASLSLYIVKASVHNRDTTNRLVSLQDGAGGTTRWRAELASEGGGSLIDFGSRGWKLTANTLLNVNLDAAGNIDVNITEYYIAP